MNLHLARKAPLEIGNFLDNVLTTVVSFQENAIRVREATNFGSELSAPAIGSPGSVTFGQ